MEQNKSSIGSIVSTIIIIALIILGGLYFWGKRLEEAKVKQDLSTNETTPTAEVSEETRIGTMNNSDDIESIEADLNATNLQNLDAEAYAE